MLLANEIRFLSTFFFLSFEISLVQPQLLTEFVRVLVHPRHLFPAAPRLRVTLIVPIILVFCVRVDPI